MQINVKLPFLQILWDEATKKWVNKDGDVTEAETFKPPPKMGNMIGNNSQPLQAPQLVAQMPQMNQYAQSPGVAQQPNPISQMENMNPAFMQQPQQPQQIPVVGGVDSAPSPAAPNMFKMQKGRSELIE